MTTDTGRVAAAGGAAGRITALARTTFTQLLRMKSFYFLLIFSVLVMLASTVNVMNYTGEQQLKILKDVSLGAMSLFSSVFAIVATAMLIPRDIEDRTLYTILAKPVRRYEYLIGKLFGVLLVVATSLAVMALFFAAVLYFQQQAVVESELAAAAEVQGMTPQDLDLLKDRVLAQGLTWNLQNAVVAIFLKSCVVCAVTMLVSTVASTSLFTIIVSFVIFFIGHVQGVARDFWIGGADAGAPARVLAALLALVFPDFQLFNVVDGVVAGELIPLGPMLRLGGLTALYLAIYVLVGFLVFVDKEL